MFFGADFATNAISFHVAASDVVSQGGDNTDGCLVRMEMARATLADLYPSCRIKFYTTDVDSLAESAATNADGNQQRDHEATARRLGASSFQFVKNSYCYYSCGHFQGDEAYECRTYDYMTLPCSIQYYAAAADCYNECGDDDLKPNECLSSTYTYYTVGSCGTGYGRASLSVACRRIISCVAITEASVSSSKKITWNLDANGGILSPQFVFYETGDCSDPEDPRSDGCRIACEDCYIDLKVLSMHADIDVTEISVDTSLKVEGAANITIAIYAPNGREITSEDDPLLSFELSVPVLMYGLSLDLSAEVARRLSFGLQPVGSVSKFGWRSNLTSRAGALDNELFKDSQLVNTANRGLKNAALRIWGEYNLITDLGAAFSVGSLGSIGVDLHWETYARLTTDVRFPDPFPALSTVTYNADSLRTYGDCSRPHFMDFEGVAGIRNAYVTFPAEFASYAGNLGTLYLISPRPISLISGCIATAYDTELLLVTAVNSVWQMDATKRDKLLKVLAWALGFPDIDVSSIEISSISADDGSVVVKLPVPPSIGDLYPESSDFQVAMYDRARTSQFSSLVSTYVGLAVGSSCQDGYWGESCGEVCANQHCDEVVCNAVDGSVFSCSSCEEGSWGSTCDYVCSSDDTYHCADGSIRCDRDSGQVTDCDACSDGYWGDD